jgi:serine phosphatase RsbU (regulator of sigma subunit)
VHRRDADRLHEDHRHRELQEGELHVAQRRRAEQRDALELARYEKGTNQIKTEGNPVDIKGSFMLLRVGLIRPVKSKVCLK